MPSLADFIPNSALGQPQLNPNRPAAPGAPGQGAISGRQSAAAGNPYDLATSFAQHYGHMPTHQIVSGMQEGIPPTPAPTSPWAVPQDTRTPSGNVTGPQQHAPGPSPAQAGHENAILPGNQGGSPETGVPAAEAGHTGPRLPWMPPPPPPPGRQHPGLRGPRQQPPAPPPGGAAPPMPPAPPQQPPADFEGQLPGVVGAAPPPQPPEAPSLVKAMEAAQAPQEAPAPVQNATSLAASQEAPPAPAAAQSVQMAPTPAAPAATTAPVGPYSSQSSALSGLANYAPFNPPPQSQLAPSGATPSAPAATPAASQPAAPSAPGANGPNVPTKEMKKDTKPLGGDVTLTGDGSLGSGYALFGLAGHAPSTGNVQPTHATTSTTTAAGSWNFVEGSYDKLSPLQYSTSGWADSKGDFHPWSAQTWVNGDGTFKSKIDPLAFIQAAPGRALTTSNFWQAMGIAPANVHNYNVLPDPMDMSSHGINGQPQTIRATADPQAPGGVTLTLPNLTGYKPGVRDLITKVVNDYTRLQNLKQNPGSGSQGSVNKEMQNLQSQLEVGLTALNQYGVTFAGPATTGGGAGGTGDGTGGDDGTGGGTGGGAGTGGGTYVPDPGTGGTGGSAAPGTDTNPGANLSDLLASAVKGDITSLYNLAVKLPGGNTNAGILANVELIQSYLNSQNARNDKQTGADSILAADRAAGNDPNRVASQNLIAGHLANPDPTDYDKIRNQYVAGKSKELTGNLNSLSADFARRGLGGASGAGLAAETYRKAAGDTAMGVGQLDIQESQAKRAAEGQAIGEANNAYQLYNLGDTRLAENYANYISGSPQPMQNQAAGLTSAYYQNQADKNGQAAQDSAKTQQGIQAAASIAALAALFI